LNGRTSEKEREIRTSLPSRGEVKTGGRVKIRRKLKEKETEEASVPPVIHSNEELDSEIISFE